MTYVIDGKPPLAELAQSGVKGMKWGVRKKYTGKQIKEARKDLQRQNKQYRIEARKVNKFTKGSAARSAGEAKLAKLHREYLNNPSRVAAVRMTNGEKAASLIFAPTGVGLGLSVASIAGTSIASRVIANKQANNSYKNVKGRRAAGGYGSPSGAMVSAGATLATALLRNVGPVAAKAIGKKAAANRAAAAGARTAPKGIGAVAAKVNYAKKSRGAFKITTL